MIPESDAAAPAAAFPELDAVESRILGCLIEKAAITPEVYPLTLNALVAACNQKTSRDPVMHLDPGAVANTLRRMEERGLVKVAPSSQRVLRYEHRFDAAYGVTARQRAVLCALLLRGAQTLGELPPPAPRQSIQVDDRLCIDFERREVTVDGQKVQLRPTEYRLLYHLASNPGTVLSHETLLSRVWGPEYRDASHYLRLYVNYLRQKIEQDPSNPKYILTERGVGYRFVDYTRDR